MGRKIQNMFKADRVIKPTPQGAAGYDNARENIDPHIKTKVISTKELTLSDGSAAGYVKNDADGVLSGGNAGGAGGVKLNEIDNPDGNSAISMGSYDLKFQYSNPASDGFNIEAIGAFSGDLLHVHQHTGNPGAVNLVGLHAIDTDVTPLCIENAGGEIFKIGNDGTVNAAGIINANRNPTGLDVLYSAEIGAHLTVGNNIIVGGTVDGIDIATDVAANTTHRGLTNNPHDSEGTNLKSTGEGGAVLFLREDGDGTCSWQAPAGGGDVTAGANLTDETIVQGDGGVKGVKTSTATVAQIADNVTKAHTAGTDPNDHASGSDDQISSNFTHNDLGGIDDGDINHLTDVEVAALHAAGTDPNDHVQGTDPNDHASGSDDQDISGIATNTTAIGLNTTHRGTAGGADHSDVNTNNGKVSYTKTNVKGHIEHGGTAGTGRPSGFTSVEWIGTVEPDNAVNGDTWIDTS